MIAGFNLQVNQLRSGTITSKNYPRDYPRDSNQTWQLDVPLGSTIELRFDDFALEERSSRNGCYDYVTVTDSDGTESEQFCGNDISSPILSTGNTMILRFYSDYGVERKGFKASWKERKEN